MVVKAKIQVREGPDKGEIEVMFNPKDYTVSTTVQTTGEGSKIQFNEVKMPEFSVPLFFDTYEKQGAERDVRKLTEKIAKLTTPTVTKKNIKTPPECLFVWGGFSYQGIIVKVDQKFTMFLESGVPCRAELAVTFKSNVTKEKFTSKTSSRKMYIVKSGDRLDLIAHRMLKDATLWRKIADENSIDNPLVFPRDSDIGRILLIPD